jgi:hypothetical protein
MSINTMNEGVLAGRRKRALDTAGLQGAPAPAAAGAAAAEPGVLSTLTRYIPTEVITLYVAFLGVATVTNGDYSPRWWGFAIFVVLTVLAVILDWVAKQRKLPKPEKSGVPLVSTAAAAIAFAAWGFALPGSPFEELSWYDSKWAGFIALVVSIALGWLMAAFGPLEEKPAA